MKQEPPFPSSNAASLETKFRKLLQNPNKILKKYVKKGMSVMDLGCGPGLYSMELSDLVGTKGEVYAVDIQQEMLDLLKNKIKLEGIKNIKVHRNTKTKIGVTSNLDFVLVLYALHEIAYPDKYLTEVYSLLKKGGKLLFVEPKFHVSRKNFNKNVRFAEELGFKKVSKPHIFLSRSVLLEK